MCVLCKLIRISLSPPLRACGGGRVATVIIVLLWRKEMKNKRARIFNIIQIEKHPVTGEILMTKEKIDEALKYRSIKKWAYICHDSDVYTKNDAKKNPQHVEGTLKPRHWHIVLKCDNAIEIAQVAKWFGIPSNYIDIPRGADGFLDCVQYLTHERDNQQKLGKKLYDDSCVESNFDFRSEINRREEMLIKYGKNLSVRDQLRHNVMYEGWTLKRAEEYDQIAYMQDFEKLRKMRLEFIHNRAPMPVLRITFYVEGNGGTGKNVACRVLAKALFSNLSDSECFFEVGGKNVGFDGYDGQPVIIWNDCRAEDLMMKYGRGEVFDIFDSHPTTTKHNIKYGSVRLVNQIHIVNGIQPYKEFLDRLSGEYCDMYGNLIAEEDKSQAYRRFPIILCLREKEFDLLINKGVAEGTREYEQFIATYKLRGNFGEISRKFEGEAFSIVTNNMIKPVIEATNMIKGLESQKISDPNLIPSEYLRNV